MLGAQKSRTSLERCGFISGARDRNRTGTPVIHEAADFKSDVSTYFTTRADDAIFSDAAVNKGYCETKGPINNPLTGPIESQCSTRYRLNGLEARPRVELG